MTRPNYNIKNPTYNLICLQLHRPVINLPDGRRVLSATNEFCMPTGDYAP